MKNPLCNRRSASRGAAALEFALVFPVLFLMMYGMLSYALIFAAQHSLTDAAAEVGRMAVRFTGTQDDKNAVLKGNKACTAVGNRVAWIGEVDQDKLKCIAIPYTSEICPENSEKIQCISVTFSYKYSDRPLLPALWLLPLPDELVGKAITQVALSY